MKLWHSWYFCNKVCIPSKTEDLNLRVLNMITGRNKSNILTKDISCEYMVE